MTERRGELESFTRAVEALEPYLGDLVFMGGWAHFLYTLRPEATPLSFEPLHTEDADVAAPLRLRRAEESIAERLTGSSARPIEPGQDHSSGRPSAFAILYRSLRPSRVR